MAEAPGRPPLFTAAFVLAWIANLLHSLAFHSFVHLPGYLEDLGADELWIGVFIAAMSVSAIAARPGVGRVMDGRGRRIVILVGGVVNIATCGLYLLVHDLGPLLFAARLLHGVAEAMLWSSLFTYAADIVPEERRTEGLALFGVSGLLPLSLGGLFGDWSLQAADYRALFASTLVYAVLGLLASLPLVESKPESHGEASGGYLAVIASQRLLPLWWIGTAFAIALSAYWAFIKTFVETTGFGTVGAFFSAYAWSAIALRIVGGRLPQRVGLKRVLVPALVAAAAGLVMIATASSGAAVAGAGILCGIGHGYAFPILSAMVVNRAREAERGTAISLFTALFDLGLLIGGPSFGALVRGTSYTVMYATAACWLVAATVVYWAWDRDD